ncbi:MAG: hypothetical protein ACLQNE_05100 [Thermoguttaceae bacterium]|jgi:hypothetical protein
MNVHRIRLRGPWSCDPAPEGICWRRRFGRPTGLQPQQSVWIVVEGIVQEGSVALNGRILGRLGVPGNEPLARFEVSGSLLPRNELWIRLENGSANGPGQGGDLGPAGEIRLEIQET